MRDPHRRKEEKPRKAGRKQGRKVVTFHQTHHNSQHVSSKAIKFYYVCSCSYFHVIFIIVIIFLDFHHCFVRSIIFRKLSSQVTGHHFPSCYCCRVQAFSWLSSHNTMFTVEKKAFFKVYHVQAMSSLCVVILQHFSTFFIIFNFPSCLISLIMLLRVSKFSVRCSRVHHLFTMLAQASSHASRSSDFSQFLNICLLFHHPSLLGLGVEVQGLKSSTSEIPKLTT